MKTMRLMRMYYDTDATDAEPAYPGNISDPFPDPAVRGATIVDVDWSVRGEVAVTYLVRVE